MCPITLVVGHHESLPYAPCFIGWLGREAGYGPVDRLAVRDVDCVGNPFSREQWDLSKSVGVSRKVATYEDCSQEAYAGRTWTCVISVCVVLVGFFPVECTSIQIIATLRYE
jgi:hypothetical protein